MTKIKYLILLFLSFNYSQIIVSADWWILWWVSTEKIKNWDIHVEDVPWILIYAINFLMWIAWTVSIIFIIVWAYRILLWSLDSNKTKWKETIMYAITWFVVASLSWIILKVIIDNFS
jgi:hypothetical protein